MNPQEGWNKTGVRDSEPVPDAEAASLAGCTGGSAERPSPRSSRWRGLCPHSLRELAGLLACLACVSASHLTKCGITSMPSFPDAHKHGAKDQLIQKGGPNRDALLTRLGHTWAVIPAAGHTCQVKPSEPFRKRPVPPVWSWSWKQGLSRDVTKHEGEEKNPGALVVPCNTYPICTDTRSQGGRGVCCLPS